MTGATATLTASRNRWWALAGVAIASFLGCIDFTVVNTAIPSIQKDLGASIAETQWIVTAYVMALSTFMVAAGRAADLWGRCRVMHAGMLLFGIGSLGAGLALDIHALIGWRLVQGLACAVLYTASTAIVTNAFPEAERGRAIGLLFSANGLGLAIGPVAGGLVVAALGWRWIFFLNVPLIALGCALCWRNVEESRGADADDTLDFAGLALFSVALPCLLLATAHGADWGWGSMRTIGSAGLGLLLLCCFIRVERRTASPLIRLDLFANSGFMVAGIATAALAFFYCAAFFLMPLYLGQVRHQHSAAIGWWLMPTTAVMGLTSPWVGRLVDRRGTTLPLLGGFFFLTVSALLQSRFNASTAWPVVTAAFVCMGIGWAAILGPSTVSALASVAQERSGAATGAAWTLHNVGGALGLSMATVMFRIGSEVPGGATSTTNFVGGYRAAMWLLASVTAAALVTVATHARSDDKRRHARK